MADATAAPASTSTARVSSDEFFSTEPEPADRADLRAQAAAFVATHTAQGHRVVLITSGGTTVPLERNTVRYLDNFSAGTRGSSSAENFLAQGCAVIFLHREGSLEPFSRHRTAASFLQGLERTDHGLSLSAEMVDSMEPIYEEYRQAMDRGLLLKLGFVTVTDYLFKLRECCQAVAAAGPNGIVYLAAAVSDFFIPARDTAQHKIQSRDGPLVITMAQIPKMLKEVVDSWCPGAFVVSFKLETDDDVIGAKAAGALDAYGHQLVISNLLHTRKRQVNLVSGTRAARTTDAIVLGDADHARGIEIEAQMIPAVLDRHAAFAAAATEAQPAA